MNHVLKDMYRFKKKSINMKSQGDMAKVMLEAAKFKKAAMKMA